MKSFGRFLTFLAVVFVIGVGVNALTDYYNRPIPFENAAPPAEGTEPAPAEESGGGPLDGVLGFIDKAKDAAEATDQRTQELEESVPQPLTVPGSSELIQEPILAEPDYSYQYNRTEQFGGWGELNGCRTRDVILARDLIEVTKDTDNCTVLSGILNDSYTGEELTFFRGADTSSLVQIDHLVPLEYAYRHGAALWSDQQRRSFANAPENLVAIGGSINASKGSDGPADFLPLLEACSYSTNFINVASSWGLTVTAADYRARTEACA